VYLWCVMSSPSSLRLYGDLCSPHDQVVWFVVELKNLPVSLVAFDWQNKPKEVLQYNPFGQIPLLIQDNNYGLYESRAIAKYLDLKFPQSQPQLQCIDHLQTQMKIEQWCYVETTAFSIHLTTISEQKIWYPLFGKICNDELVLTALEKLKKLLIVIEAHLSQSAYFVGDSLTLADVFFTPLIQEAFQIPEFVALVSGYPHFQAWWSRVSQTPAWLNVMKKVEADRQRFFKMAEDMKAAKTAKKEAAAVMKE